MIIKNLTNFIKSNKLLFAFLLTTQIAAVIIILFSFGIYRNNQYKLAESENEEQTLGFIFNPDRDENIIVEVSRIQNDLIEITKKYEQLVDDVVIYSYGHLSDEDNLFDDNVVRIRSEFNLVKDGVEHGVYHENILRDVVGRDFTKEELNNGSKVCFASSWLNDLHEDYWIVDGISYEVIAHEEPADSTDYFPWSQAFVIPFNSLAAEMELDYIYFVLERPLLRSEYETIKAEFTSRFSEAEMEVSDFYSIEIDEKATMKTMLLAAIFMSLISAFSVCLIYRYMLAIRIQTTAIYRICGCTTARSSLIYIGEMVAVLFTSCIIGSMIFELLVEPVLEKDYTWFAIIYENNNHYLLVVLYFLIVALIAAMMIIVKNQKTPKELLNSKIN